MASITAYLPAGARSGYRDALWLESFYPSGYHWKQDGLLKFLLNFLGSEPKSTVSPVHQLPCYGEC